MIDWVKTDNLTIFLAASFIGAYALSQFLKPQSLVHPLLFGRQSDVARVRNPGESAVYRNYATGLLGRLPERPKAEIKLLGDLVQDSPNVSRTLWSTAIANIDLKERARALANGLMQIVGLTPRTSTVLLLLDDGTELLITDLALASHSVLSITLSSLSLLVPALEKHAPAAIIVHSHILKHVLDHITDSRRLARHSIIVLGKSDGVSTLQNSGIRVFEWEDLEVKGRALQRLDVPSPEPNDVFSVSYFAEANGVLQGAQLSHANVTAGVTSARLLFPHTEPISQLDTLFSVFSIAGAYGRTILYTALYEGANFSSVPASLQLDKGLESLELIKACNAVSKSPTILFLMPSQLKPLTSSILENARSHPMFRLAWRHKLVGLREGFITKASLWDNLTLKAARTRTLGKLEASLRGIVISDGRLETSVLESTRIAFSIPIVFTLSHPLVCGPMLMTHPLDMQSFPGETEPHVGPPAPNVEVKLVGVLDSSIEKGGDPTGNLLVRGPSVTQRAGGTPEEWVSTGQKARVQTNGTFKILI